MNDCIFILSSISIDNRWNLCFIQLVSSDWRWLMAKWVLCSLYPLLPPQANRESVDNQTHSPFSAAEVRETCSGLSNSMAMKYMPSFNSNYVKRKLLFRENDRSLNVTREYFDDIQFTRHFESWSNERNANLSFWIQNHLTNKSKIREKKTDQI